MTNLNRVAIQCTNDSNHQMFRETDGARCLECKGIMKPIPVSEAEYRLLPSYVEWHNQRREQPKQSISIAVEADTNKLQLKLSAIAKHTAALARELDAIENAWQCSECGSNSYTTLFDGTNIVMCTCDGCGKHLTNDALPTQSESSD